MLDVGSGVTVVRDETIPWLHFGPTGDVAWQVDQRLDSGSAANPPDFAQVEILSRYLRDELGWEEFRTVEAFGGPG